MNQNKKGLLAFNWLLGQGGWSNLVAGKHVELRIS